MRREQPTRQGWGRPSDARLRTLGCRLSGLLKMKYKGERQEIYFQNMNLVAVCRTDGTI